MPKKKKKKKFLEHEDVAVESAVLKLSDKKSFSSCVVVLNFNFSSNLLKKCQHYEINSGPTGDMKRLYMDSQVSGFEWINPW